MAIVSYDEKPGVQAIGATKDSCGCPFDGPSGASGEFGQRFPRRRVRRHFDGHVRGPFEHPDHGRDAQVHFRRPIRVDGRDFLPH